MSYHTHYRPSSPGSRYTIDPMRASTGTVQLSSSYDPYDYSTNRYGYTPYPSDYHYAHSYAPRVNHDRRVEALPVLSKTYRDPGNSTKLRTEYAVRQRPRSSTTSGTDSHPTPVRPAVPSSLDTRSPVITSSYGRTPSPLPSETERYIMPASSRHGRHRRIYSTDYSSDTGRLRPHDAAARRRVGHGAYREYAPSGRKRYSTAEGLKKGGNIDDHDAYSYTTPKEQFEKESVARLNYRRGAHRMERPTSMNGIDDYSQRSSKTESRAPGPPPSQRGFDKLERDTRLRRSAHGPRDDEVARDVEGSRHLTNHLSPVSLHQDDDGYSSHKEDYGDGHHRRHHRPRRHDDNGARQIHDDRDLRQRASDLSTYGPGAGSGAATLASGYSDDFDYHSSRTNHHHSRGPGRRHVRDAAGVRDGDHRGRNYQSRRPQQLERGSDVSISDEDVRNYKREPPARRKYSGSDTSSGKETPSQYLTVDKPRRRRSSHSRHRAEDGHPMRVSSQQGSASGQEDFNKSSSVDSVKQLDASPKGILKQPRDKFPEEPNPVREGVAPLKDAHKKGIPPGARWTKIDRRLVNPAALEAFHERFEERSTCVIVLRVLTKEEIQVFAIKTQEIRGMLFDIHRLLQHSNR